MRTVWVNVDGMLQVSAVFVREMQKNVASLGRRAIVRGLCVSVCVANHTQALLYKTEHLKLLVPDSGADQAFGQRTNRRTKEYMEVMLAVALHAASASNRAPDHVACMLQWWACMGRFSREFVAQFRHVRLHMYKFLKDS